MTVLGWELLVRPLATQPGHIRVMAISEAARSDLYNGLRDVLGPERAETLMSAIPLYELDVVATKGDLAELRAELKVELAELRVEVSNEIGALRKTMTHWMLTVLVTVVGAMVGIALIA
jgi:hypothetical protein